MSVIGTAVRLHVHNTLKLGKGDVVLYLLGLEHVTHVVKVTDRWSTILQREARETMVYAAERPEFVERGDVQGTFHEVAHTAPVLKIEGVASVELAIAALA